MRCEHGQRSDEKQAPAPANNQRYPWLTLAPLAMIAAPIAGATTIGRFESVPQCRDPARRRRAPGSNRARAPSRPEYTRAVAQAEEQRVHEHEAQLGSQREAEDATAVIGKPEKNTTRRRSTLSEIAPAHARHDRAHHRGSGYKPVFADALRTPSTSWKK